MVTRLAAVAAFVLLLTGRAEAQYYYYPTAGYPVYTQPAPTVVYNAAPVYYAQPVYAPVYAQPVYQQPVYAQPIYAAPVYAPYYGGGGYYSPLSIALSFGFGGGHRHWH